MLDTGYRMQDAGGWDLEFGIWNLISGISSCGI
jgi:hypothetical protein